MLERMLHRHEMRLLLVVLVLVAILSVTTKHFFTLQNLFDLLTSYAFTGILAAGLLVVLVSGGIDISFTATASVAQYVAVSLSNTAPTGWAGVFAVALGVGLMLGLFNAIIITWLRLSSIIATIATLNLFYGLLVFITHGNYIYTLPDFLAQGINVPVGGYAMNLQVLLLIVTFVVVWLLLDHTSIGRQIYAMGGNREAAKRVGINVFRLSLLCYGLMGLTAGIASIADAQLEQSVMPTSLVGKELHVLAAVVLGGASLTGGVGSVFGTILGVALLAIAENGLIIVGVPSYWLDFFAGVLILLAVSSTAIEYSAGRRRKRVVVAS